MDDWEAATARLDRQIDQVDRQIDQVDTDLKTAKSQGSAEQRTQLRTEKERLRTEQEQLRTEKEQLRTEQELLLRQELQLFNLRPRPRATGKQYHGKMGGPGLGSQSSSRRLSSLQSVFETSKHLCYHVINKLAPLFLRGIPSVPARLPLQLEHEIFGVFSNILHGRGTILSEGGSSIQIENGEVDVLDLTDMSIRPADFEERVIDLCQASVKFYSTANSRVMDGLKDKFEAVLDASLEPLPLRGKQWQAAIDLACSGDRKQVQTALPALLPAACMALHSHWFKVVKKLCDRALVYLIDLNGKAAVAKLSMKYGWATHKSWADGGFAPRLLLEHCRDLAGGWKLIVMEYLRPDNGWHPVTYAEDAKAVWQALEAHFCSARERSPSLVQGDLRSTNIFVCK
ncbi:hypothetical protein WJX74_001863 [Apatococcus lobatus]|uniref:Uncharacterized protein n=1 Tax=Apatococcus lobatus TaxID=904363 RepID=A0AAW1SDP5_9CHLO